MNYNSELRYLRKLKCIFEKISDLVSFSFLVPKFVVNLKDIS